MNAARPQTEAAQHLREFFAQQLAEAMPKAFEMALRDAFAISRFLVNGTMRVQPVVCPVYEGQAPADLQQFGVPTLLVLLFDKRQPAGITAAARDALAARFLEDDDTQALIIRSANSIARQAVQDLQLEQAEHKALFGRIGASVSAEQCAAMDETAEYSRVAS